MTSYFKYHICNSISYFSLHIPYFTLHTSYFTLHYSHSTLPIALRTAFFTPHTSHCTLPTPYFILFELFSPYPSSFLLISFLLICYLNFHELFLNIATKEFVCTVRQPGLCVRALYETIAIMLSKKMTRSWSRYNAISTNFLFPSYFILHFPTPRSIFHTCTSSQLISSELFSSHFISSHMSAKFFLAIFMSSERSSNFLISPKLVSTHLGSSARQKAWDTDAFTQKSLYKILCTTKLAQSTSQYNLVLHSLHRVLPSSTLYTRLEETPFTSSHLFVTHFNSSVCQKFLVTNRIPCAHTFYIV